MSALELATTEDLLKELSTRFETLVYVGQKAENPVGSNVFVNAWRYKGNRWKCIGLAFSLISLLNKQFDEELEELDPGNL